MGITAILGSAVFVFASDAQRHGGWDAFVIWNLRAQFLANSASPVAAILDPAFLGLHPDYPLLLPSLVSRGWQYAGSSTPVVPIALAALFTITTVIIIVAGLRIICPTPQSWLTGTILLGTPFLFGLGAAQYADAVIGCFMTAAIVAFAIYDLSGTHSHTGLPFIAGVAAAAAACTKNEGILFLIVLLAARVIAALLGKSAAPAQELIAVGIGASFGILTLALFKFGYSPPNDTVQWAAPHIVLAHLLDPTANFGILKGIRDSLNFGQWYVTPLPFMAIHVAIAWRPAARSTRVTPWFTPTFVVVGMSVGYYLVFLLSPYDVESHVVSSLPRLLLQLWPTSLVLYSVMVSPRLSELPSTSSRHGLARAAVVLAVAVISLSVWKVGGKPDGPTAEGKPHIELDRTVVLAGETYSIKIAGIRGPQVYVSYSLDGKPLGQFGAYLGADSTVRFQVTAGTPKGIYRFLAVRSATDPAWIGFDNDASITVQ